MNNIPSAMAPLSTKMSARQEMIHQVRLSLGEPKIRIELTPEHYEMAMQIALERYRLRSVNSVVEKFTFIELQVDQTTYQLPENIVEVKEICRRGTSGTVSGGGNAIDPFSLQYQNLFLLQAGREGGLLTYELFADFQKTIGRMFGAYITFQYDKNTHELRIDRDVRQAETVLLWIYESKPDEVLIRDSQARNWLRDYTIAKCKELLATVRGKWSSYSVPGSANLDSDQLRTEAQATMERLEAEIASFTDSFAGMPFFIG